MVPAIESMAVVSVTALGVDASGAVGAATAAVRGCDVFVDVAELVDVEAEVARLDKELVKIEGFIEAKRRKLADATFTQRAPAPVVQKEREQLADLESRLANGRAALAELRTRRASPG
jgi:valyl-tRNA synthetase